MLRNDRFSSVESLDFLAGLSAISTLCPARRRRHPTSKAQAQRLGLVLGAGTRTDCRHGPGQRTAAFASCTNWSSGGRSLPTPRARATPRPGRLPPGQAGAARRPYPLGPLRLTAALQVTQDPSQPASERQARNRVQRSGARPGLSRRAESESAAAAAGRHST
jgi:hypothetical protein